MKLSEQTKGKVRVLLIKEIKRVQKIRADEAKRLKEERRKKLEAEIGLEKKSAVKNNLNRQLAILNYDEEGKWIGGVIKREEGRLEVIIRREKDPKTKDAARRKLAILKDDVEKTIDVLRRKLVISNDGIESDKEIDSRIDLFLQSAELVSPLKLRSKQELISQHDALEKIRKNFLKLDPDTQNAFEDVVLEIFHNKMSSNPSLFELFELGYIKEVTTDLGDVISDPKLLKAMFAPPEIFLEDVITACRGILDDALSAAIDDTETPKKSPDVEANVYMVALLIHYYKKHTGLRVISVPGKRNQEEDSRGSFFQLLLDLMYNDLGISKQADWKIQIEKAEKYLSFTGNTKARKRMQYI